MRMAAWILAVLAVLALPMVMAEPSAASVSIGTEQNYTNVTTTAGQVDANAGYVVEVNASSVSNTTYWAGVYGTVSLQKVLGAGSDTFFSWNGTPDWIYFVYGTVDWTSTDYISSSLTDANIVSMGIWGTTPTIETLDDTYPDSGATGACGSITLAAGESERRVTLEGTWTNCIAARDNANGFEGTDDTLVVVSNVQSGTAFNGATVDYEALLPAGSATAYVVYVE